MWIELNNWMIDTEKLCGIMQSDDTIRLYHSPMKDPDIFDFASEEDFIEAYKKILAGIKKGDRVVDLNDYRSNGNFYYYLKDGDIIQDGDECEMSNNWNEPAKWVPAAPHNFGQPAPDPNFISHRRYRRLVK